jgi:hypothetical protein
MLVPPNFLALDGTAFFFWVSFSFWTRLGRILLPVLSLGHIPLLVKEKKDNSAGASRGDSPKQDVIVDLEGASSNHGIGEIKTDVGIQLDAPSKPDDDQIGG